MKTILLATDFSLAADNAAEYSAQMARAINARLVLFHVYQIPIAYMEVPVAATEEEITSNANQKLEHLRHSLAEKTGFKISIETALTTGVFFQELKALCERLNPYTVVMGSQGTTAAERLFFGSHTIHAMKELDWPLITVPPEVKFTSIKKIGFACDFNKVTDTIPVDEIKVLVNDFNAELHILNTGKQKVFDPGIVFESGIVNEMLADVKPSYHFTTNEDTDDGIIDFTERNDLDLLVVLPKRHGFIERLTHKSHTKHLVLHSHVPVMALHH